MKITWPVRELRIMVRSYYDVQDSRLRMDGRLRKAGKDELLLSEEWKATMKQRIVDFEALERRIFGHVTKLLEDIPPASWLLAEKGIGPGMAGVVVSEYADPVKAPTVSAMWSFAGLNVWETGRAPAMDPAGP